MAKTLPQTLLLALTLVACDRESPPGPPQNHEVLRAFGSAPPAGVEGDDPRLDLYIDGSGSMKGYVSQPDSTYCRALDSLLDRAATAGYGLRLFRFSDQVVGIDSLSAAGILSPQFYAGSQTSFPRLFNHIAGQQEENTISVIVSDLVQSGRASDQRALVVAFEQLAKKRPAVLLLGFRSAFSGMYFVEGQRSGAILRLALDGGLAASGRPFYIVIVAPSHALMEQARKLLLPNLGGHEEFDASSPGVAVTAAAFLPPEPGDEQVWNIFRAPEALPAVVTPRPLLSFVELAAPARETSLLRVRLTVPADTAGSVGPLRSPGSLNFASAGRTFRGGKWGALRAIDLAPEALFAGSSPALDLTYSFRRPAPFSWDVYRIRISPGTGNLRLPPWVEEWSTLDDSLEMWGNRTLKLDLFVEALTRSIREQVPFCEHYILLGRGE